MRVWLNSNYSIYKDDSNYRFGEGNHMYDYIELLILTSSIKNDNTLPVFKFKLKNGRVLGPYTHNVSTYEDGYYTVFRYNLSSNILSDPGILEITFEIQYFNTNRVIYKTKNTSVIGYVEDNVIIGDDIIIVENKGEIIESMVENIMALNKRITDLENST